MAFVISENANRILNSGVSDPNIVLKFSKVPTNFSAQILKVIARYGEGGLVYGQDGLVWGGNVQDDFQKEYVSLNGTSASISQQIEPDKGSTSSTQTIVVRLVDKNQEISALISPETGYELLYDNAEIYVSPSAESAFPEDYILLFNGKVQTIQPGPGYVDFTIAHPEDLTRSEIFYRAETVLATNAFYLSAKIGDLLYSQRGDVTGTITVTYVFAGLGDDAVVSVVGNDITVQIDTVFTKAKTIRKKIENNEDANQLVGVQILGNAGNVVQTYIGTSTLTTSSTIQVESVQSFLLPALPWFRTYARINDEIAEYTGIDVGTNTLTGVTRASLTSFGANHSIGDEVQSFYKLGDATFENSNACELALRVLLSNGPANYASKTAKNFLRIDPSTTVANCIFFEKTDLIRFENVTVGDTCTSSGASNGANNFSLKVVDSVVKTETGTYITISGVSLVEELNTSAVVTFQSRYNVLPDGVGLIPAQVDVDQFENIKTVFISSVQSYELYLKDTINSQELVNEQILRPSAIYSIPRKGRISINMTAPPLYSAGTKTLTVANVQNASKLKITRSINRHFANSIIWKMNVDSVEDKYLSGRIAVSNDSNSRIGAPNKPIQIDADGIRPSESSLAIVDRASKRMLQRYQFAAEGLWVEPLVKDGFTVEVGDSIIFGDPDLNLPDITEGSRAFKPRVFEVQNKEYNWQKGEVRLYIVDTAYNQLLRYAVWSPTSKLAAGSTTTRLVLETSPYTRFPRKERDKWNPDYINKNILIHNEDYSITYSTVITGIDPGNDAAIYIDTIGGAPPAGFIVDVENYDAISVQDTFLKAVHPFWTPVLTVTSGVSATSFNVSLLDAAKLFVGSLVRIHNDDYSIDSGVDGTKVTAIAGTLVTVEDDLGFTPSASQKVEFVGFKIDEGQPYGWL